MISSESWVVEVSAHESFGFDWRLEPSAISGELESTFEFDGYEVMTVIIKAVRRKNSTERIMIENSIRLTFKTVFNI